MPTALLTVQLQCGTVGPDTKSGHEHNLGHVPQASLRGSYLVEELQQVAIDRLAPELVLEDPVDVALQQDVVVAGNHSHLTYQAIIIPVHTRVLQG
jgi:hypothetical protein